MNSELILERENNEVINNSGKVSFIVPVYNMEKSLQICIDSIINQTYDNIEVILIDDGSKDASGNICDEYARRDNRIKVVHKENGGIADATNVGLDMVTGQYILFVDSDDFIEKVMAQIMVQEICDKQADIAQCGMVIHSIDGKVIRNASGKSGMVDGTKNILETYFQWKGIGGNLAGKMFKAKMFSNIRMPSGRMFADVPIIPLLLNQCQKYIFVQEGFYHVLSNPQSVSRGIINESKFSDILYNVEKVCSFIEAEWPMLEYHIYYLKASTAAYYYDRVSKSNELKNVHEKKKMLKKEFRSNYKKLIEIKAITKYPIVRRVQLHLFRINPYLSIYVEKVYRLFVAG